MTFERFKALAPLLLSQSTEHEREILAGALEGDLESRKAALFLASMQVSEGQPISPALEHWLGAVLQTLNDAVNHGGSMDEALAQIGYEKRRGRPSGDTLDRDLQVLCAVSELANITTKSEAVRVVADGLGLSEQAVWAVCSKLAKVITVPMPPTDRERLARTVRDKPEHYSKELRDFLAVTESS